MLLTRYHKKTENMAAGATEKKVAPMPNPAKPEKPADRFEYTEDMINKMSGPQLRKLAKKSGVENPEEFTVKELKSVLCGLLVK